MELHGTETRSKFQVVVADSPTRSRKAVPMASKAGSSGKSTSARRTVRTNTNAGEPHANERVLGAALQIDQRAAGRTWKMLSAVDSSRASRSAPLFFSDAACFSVSLTRIPRLLLEYQAHWQKKDGHKPGKACESFLGISNRGCVSSCAG